MSKPGCAQLGGLSAGKKFGLANGDGWRGGIGGVRFAVQSTQAAVTCVRYSFGFDGRQLPTSSFA